MGVDRADVSGGAQRWPSAYDVSAGGDGRDFVYWVKRLCLGDVAQMLSAGFDGAPPVLEFAEETLDEIAPTA